MIKEKTLRELMFTIDGIYLIPRVFTDSPAIHKQYIEIQAHDWVSDRTWAEQAGYEKKLLSFLRQSVAQTGWIPEGSIRSSGCVIWFQFHQDMVAWLEHAKRGIAMLRLMDYVIPESSSY